MKISIVIPFYNEEKNVEGVIKDIVSSLKETYEIIAVDNGSSDRTGEIIDKLTSEKIRKVRIKKNLGYGYGVLKGLECAKGEWIGWIDGDGQTDSGYIMKLYNLAKEKKNGIFKIKRVNRHDGLQRSVFSRLFNLFTSGLLGIKSKDINACPKLFRREVFAQMKLQSKDWFIDTELLLKAGRMKLPVYEVPAVFDKREEGKSNVYLHTSLEFVKNILKYYFSK